MIDLTYIILHCLGLGSLRWATSDKPGLYKTEITLVKYTLKKKKTTLKSQ